MKKGFPVGIFVRAVAVITVDATQDRAADLVYRIKGEARIGKPMATLIPAAAIVDLIDPDQIPAPVRHIFLDGTEWEARLGTLASVRVPIRARAALDLPAFLRPQSKDGRYWLQSWVADQTSTGGLLLKEFQAQDVNLPGVTSLNASGRPEIVDQDQALAFSAARDIPYFLGDPDSRSSVRGSFPILQVSGEGVRLVRQGHFSAALFPRLLDGFPVDTANAAAAKYPLLQTDDLLCIQSPYELRQRLVERLEGGMER